jgi:hypothetical protein
VNCEQRVGGSGTESTLAQLVRLPEQTPAQRKHTHQPKLSKKKSKMTIRHIGLVIVEVRNEDGELIGWSFIDSRTTQTWYQVSAPAPHEERFCVVRVLHEEPFEFVQLGFNKTYKGATSRVRKHFIADVITAGIAGTL